MQTNKLHNIFPFLEWLPQTTGDSLKKDLFAGLTGAIIVLPQGVAFAMIAGMPPIYGLYTAMITPIIAALFGSSKHLISGPTTAISIVVFSAVSAYAPPSTAEFVAIALLLTLIAGTIQFVMGLARMGTLVNFISHTVVIGFTAGAAILIAVKQLKYALGLQLPGGMAFHEIFIAIGQHASEINYTVLGVAMVTLGVAIAGKIWIPKWPYMLIAMIVGSVMAYFLGGEAAGITLVGEMPAQLPPFAVPTMDFAIIKELAPDAFAIALLGLIEAVAIARSIAMHSGQQINGNREFIGQGLSNMVGSFFSCYAGSGSFTRSGVNFTAGAQTPLAAIFAALLLMAVVLFIAPLTSYLPIAAMAGIILFVAYNLIDFKHIREIISVSGRESTVLIITFLSTLFLHLEFAIYIGVIFSLVLFLQRTSTPRVVPMGTMMVKEKEKIVSLIRKKNAEALPNTAVARIDGSIFFGSIGHIQVDLDKIAEGKKNILILADSINLIDMAGAEMLVHLAKKKRAEGGGLYLSGLKRPVRQYLLRGTFWKDIGMDNIYDDEMDALKYIRNRMSSSDVA